MEQKVTNLTNLTGRLDFRLHQTHRDRFQTLANSAEMRLSDALRLLVCNAIQFNSLKSYQQHLESEMEGGQNG